MQPTDRHPRLKVAFVVQRFGEDVGGGAEDHCRQVARHMARHWDVTVLTTTAQDYRTWANHYPPGRSAVDDFQLVRFPIRGRRRAAPFDRLSPRVLDGVHSDAEEERWLVMQGPDCPELLDHLAERSEAYDIIVFVTYLYATTALGLPLVRDRAWLVPTAHDEKPIYLRYFDELFAMPRRILFNTEAERRFCCRRFSRAADWGHVVGCGIVPAPPAPAGDVRRKFDLPERYLLYLGRIDPAKGVEDLLANYARARTAIDDLPPLLLAGRWAMSLSEPPGVRCLGFVEESEKARLLADAELLIVPSFFESLSLVLLEGWSAGTPALVNGRCEVLRDQVVRASGGLYYGSSAEFVEALRWLLENQDARGRMADLGRSFTREHYSWDRIEQQYLAIASDDMGKTT